MRRGRLTGRRLRDLLRVSSGLRRLPRPSRTGIDTHPRITYTAEEGQEDDPASRQGPVLPDTIARVEYEGFSWTAAARKHRVSRAQMSYVVVHAGPCFVRPAAPPDRPDEALLFLGDDEEGMPLEVVGV
jgi:hypothetical protein